MTSLRRTVEGWMGDDLYRKLGDEPDIDITWKLLRELIGQQLFGSEYVTVPYIESAVYYNQLFLFTKKKSLLSRLGLRPPKYKTVGNLDYLVNRDISTWIPQFDFSPWDVADGLTMYREYKLRVASNRSTVEKAIELMIMEAHVRSAQPPLPGTVTIHTNLLQDLQGVKTLYVITDVVFASYVKLSVMMGNRQKSLVYDHDTPIGFKYRKFSLRSDGYFVAEMNTALKFTDKEAHWLRPTPQPVPTVPRWDPMRRRYTGSGGRRKMRNNLTIPTPEEPGRINNRGSWLRDGGVIRIERPIANGGVMNTRDVIALENNAPEQNEEWRDNMFQRIYQNNNVHLNNRRSVSLDNIINV
ncbi:uncharacterized protein TNIN_335311 [Trichonephila inaurata madagascariensis]|uniref:Uncharacterized protein n=1 Tax=Trichonephila inaurata madagascariensis TaxID=2747483 RepID=A0A8X6IAW5_9ARAC|nr:uncharacterized protein TNIN_335311 [Trichonephila inaurata madagascariensis]